MKFWGRWIGLAFLLPFAASTAGALAGAKHLVFAHYMVCHATYGESPTGYWRDIQDAQAAGIDGFALNLGAWDEAQPSYKRRVALLYQAAERLGSDFKLFFSIDFDGPKNVVNVVESYANRVNTFRHQGKIVLSAYGHNEVPSVRWPGMDWTNAIIGKLQKDGFPIFFVPFFFCDPVHELPSYSDAVFVLNKYAGVLDGVFCWGAGGLPLELAQCNSNYTAAAHAFGKLSMASVAPHYWGCMQYGIGRRYYEFDGGEGLVTQWSSIIANQPDWVEICTWNDFDESTYVSPVEEPGRHSSYLQTPKRYCHNGYLELSKRFIAWYKTGVPPVTTNDALFYFYRTHPKDAVASRTNDPPVTWRYGDVQDRVYTTVFLTSPAGFQVSTGNLLTTNFLPAGLSQLRIPFAPGPQRFTLTRNGTQVLTAQGPDILSQIQYYDFFPASGYAYGSRPLASRQ